MTWQRPLGLPGFDDDTGHGILDAFAAVLAVLGQDPILAPGETVHVQVRDAVSGAVVFSAATSDAALLDWEIADVVPGSFRILAGTDRDGDGDVTDAGEITGTWRDGNGNDILNVAAGTTLSDLDIVIRPG